MHPPTEFHPVGGWIFIQLALDKGLPRMINGRCKHLKFGVLPATADQLLFFFVYSGEKRFMKRLNKSGETVGSKCAVGSF
jgi:hypothetical protein